MTRPRRYRRIITGGGISTSGFSVDTSLLPTEAHHCQQLVDLIDDKDVFVAPHSMEIGSEVVPSVAEVRRMATSTKGLLDSEETRAETENIAAACRHFMRDYKVGDDPRVLNASLDALRKEVGTSVAFLVDILKLHAPTNFDISSYRISATEILDGWLKKPI